jgi:peroxiredoxin
MARRSIFIVDRQGVIRWTWVSSRETPQPDYDLVVEEAKRVAAAG